MTLVRSNICMRYEIVLEDVSRLFGGNEIWNSGRSIEATGTARGGASGLQPPKIPTFQFFEFKRLTSINILHWGRLLLEFFNENMFENGVIREHMCIVNIFIHILLTFEKKISEMILFNQLHLC